MAYDVTSAFISESQQRSPTVARKFYIGSSDYSSYVTKWPTVSRRWDDVKPTGITINLANEDKAFNFLYDDKINMRQQCRIDAGFTVSGSDHVVTVYEGNITQYEFAEGSVTLSLLDTVKQLAERTVGSPDSPVDFTGSNYLPSDIVWTLVTCYGGYSTVQSDSNPDLDYQSFLDWSFVFSSNNVLVQAYFDGQKVLEALRTVARQTLSAIFQLDNKLSFHKFSIVNSDYTDLDDDSIRRGLRVRVDDTKVINKQMVAAVYSRDGGSWGATLTVAETPSVSSYGLREHLEQDDTFWYVNTVSALDLAQRKVYAYGYPYDVLSIDAMLNLLPRQIGEMVFVTNSFMGISNNFRIMDQSIDLNTGAVRITADTSLLAEPFILNTSSLGGRDLLT